MQDKSVLTQRDLAERYGVCVATIAKWRREGTGPKYMRLSTTDRSRIRYTLEDVIEFERNRAIQ